jgi:hypothetical protein
MGCFGRQETLYVVLPYFNFCGFKRRRELFVAFVQSIQITKGIQVVIVEADGPAPLPRLPAWRHVKVDVDSPVWLKENLVNIGARELPKDWKYIAWIDADIEFLNRKWVQDAITELKSYDIVQMFQTCVNMGPSGESLKIDKSFGYMHRDSGTAYTKTDRYGFWHPGYAWACTRKAYDQMRGLVDWAILGSGDRHMALAWIGRALDSAPGNIHRNYRAMLAEYQIACRGLEVSYIEGTILHFWHGRFEDRRYKERWEILTRNNFDPLTDTGMTDAGLVQLSPEGQRLAKELKGYFEGRREDS